MAATAAERAAALEAAGLTPAADAAGVKEREYLTPVEAASGLLLKSHSANCGLLRLFQILLEELRRLL